MKVSDNYYLVRMSGDGPKEIINSSHGQTDVEKSVTIHDLPPEILDWIITLAKVERKLPQQLYHNNSFAGSGRDFRGDPNKISPNEEYPLYKAIRCVCKRWNLHGTPLLFRTIVLLSHSKVGKMVVL